MRALWLGGLATAAADVVSFNDTLFHVTLAGTFPPTPSCILNRDVHLLSGTVDGQTGGTVRVRVINGTLPDYDLVFGPSIKDRGFLVHNVTAKLPCNSAADPRCQPAAPACRVQRAPEREQLRCGQQMLMVHLGKWRARAVLHFGSHASNGLDVQGLTRRQNWAVGRF